MGIFPSGQGTCCPLLSTEGAVAQKVETALCPKRNPQEAGGGEGRRGRKKAGESWDLPVLSRDALSEFQHSKHTLAKAPVLASCQRHLQRLKSTSQKKKPETFLNNSWQGLGSPAAGAVSLSTLYLKGERQDQNDRTAQS